jgi:hypothetical protein
MHRAEKAWHYLSIALMVSGSLTIIAIVATTRNGLLVW